MDYHNTYGKKYVVDRTNGDWTPEGGTGGVGNVEYRHMLKESTIDEIERLLIDRKSAVVELQDDGSVVVKEYSN